MQDDESRQDCYPIEKLQYYRILEQGDELDYIPGPDSPTGDKKSDNDDEDEDDPLDNFMANIEVRLLKFSYWSLVTFKIATFKQQTGSSQKRQGGQ